MLWQNGYIKKATGKMTTGKERGMLPAPGENFSLLMTGLMNNAEGAGKFSRFQGITTVIEKLHGVFFEGMMDEPNHCLIH